MRAQVVKQHHVTKGNYTAAGFFDGSLEEKAKKEGDEVVRRMINGGLDGCSVLCVLVGTETYTRRWVDYEIFESIELGMAVLGIRIHQISDPKLGADDAGPNPFDYLGYGRKSDKPGKLSPMVKYDSGWKDAPYQLSITGSAAPYARIAPNDLYLLEPTGSLLCRARLWCYRWRCRIQEPTWT
jgi:hypothetical protein